MYEFFNFDIFTVCRLTLDEGPYVESQVVTTEYESREQAENAAKEIIDSYRIQNFPTEL